MLHKSMRSRDSRLRLQLPNKAPGPLQSLQTVRQELNHYQCLKMKCSEDAALQKRFEEKEMTYDFLAGLNMEYDE